MWAKGNNGGVYNFLFENKIVPNEKNKYAQRGIAAPTGRISKSLIWHPPAKKRVKQIKDSDYKCGYHILWGCKGSRIALLLHPKMVFPIPVKPLKN